MRGINKVRNLQEIKSDKQSKYGEVIEYLSQDNGYWLENDKWDFEIEIFFNNVVKVGNATYKHIDFSGIKSINLKNEIKFFSYIILKKVYLQIKLLQGLEIL